MQCEKYPTSVPVLRCSRRISNTLHIHVNYIYITFSHGTSFEKKSHWPRGDLTLISVNRLAVWGNGWSIG